MISKSYIICFFILCILTCINEHNISQHPKGKIKFSFAITADMRQYTGDNINYFRKVCEEIKSLNITKFMISPGDVDPPDKTHKTIKKYIDENYQWYPAIGNHEADTESDMNYIRNMNKNGNLLPNVINLGPPGSVETTYSFNYMNTHFVILNEYYDGVIDTGTNGDIVPELLNWLNTDLSNNIKPIVFIIGHEPAYPQPDAESNRLRNERGSLNYYEFNRNSFWNLLYTHSVVAYICGHTHNYSVVKINGVWQIDAGHARGIADTGARSTFIIIYILENNEIWLYCHRLNFDTNNYEIYQKILLD